MGDRVIWPNAIGFPSRSQAFYDKPQLIESKTFQTLLRFTGTRDADQAIHVLTNLPSKVSAVRVADLYRQSWTLEQAFNELTTLLALRTQHAGLSQGGVIRVLGCGQQLQRAGRSQRCAAWRAMVKREWNGKFQTFI
jgi:hypothetical protein